jgi:hypothetical protein
VIGTDYTNYAVIYSCTTILGNCFSFNKYLWLLSRKPLVQGTADFDAFMAIVNPIIAEKVPKYDTRI